MNRFLFGALAVGAVLALSSYAVRDVPAAPKRTATALKLADLTLDKARRFNVPAPLSVVIPPGMTFVMTDGSSFGDLLVVINGSTRAHLPTSGILRTFDPPILVHPGDLLALVGSGTANLGGYVVAPVDVAPTVPNPLVPLALKDFTLDRAQHHFIPNAAAGWSLTNPVGSGGSLVLVSWFGGPAFFSINGNTVAEVGMPAFGLKEYRFAAPIIVDPGQTVTINSTVPSDGELGGYTTYTGET